MTEPTVDLRWTLHSAAVTVGHAVVFGASLIGFAVAGLGIQRSDAPESVCAIVGLFSGAIFFTRAFRPISYRDAKHVR